MTAVSWMMVTATVLLSPDLPILSVSRSGPSPWTYLLNQSVMITHYLRLVVWPHGLVSDYGYPSHTP